MVITIKVEGNARRNRGFVSIAFPFVIVYSVRLILSSVFSFRVNCKPSDLFLDNHCLLEHFSILSSDNL